MSKRHAVVASAGKGGRTMGYFRCDERGLEGQMALNRSRQGVKDEVVVT